MPANSRWDLIRRLRVTGETSGDELIIATCGKDCVPADG